jgi:SAM-dependent methyltransferase
MNDPMDPGFWNSRYESEQTPWDFGGLPADFQAFLKRKKKQLQGAKVLVPGCGSGYEVAAFAEAGADVMGMDISSAAVKRAQQVVGRAFAERIIKGDVFAYDFDPASFDFIYERTFLCAIPPQMREQYRDRMAELLKRSGMLVGYFFYKKTEPREGPPFGLAWGEGDALFSRHFLLLKDDPVTDSLPMFDGRERWQERHRTAKPVRD